MPAGRTGTKTSSARSAGGRQVRISMRPMFPFPGNKNGIRRTANSTSRVKNRRLPSLGNFLLFSLFAAEQWNKKLADPGQPSSPLVTLERPEEGPSPGFQRSTDFRAARISWRRFSPHSVRSEAKDFSTAVRACLHFRRAELSRSVRW